MAALCGDAARQPEEVKAAFAQGLENLLAGVESPQMREKLIDSMAHAIGAIVLSRACPDDSALADEIIEVCRKEIVGPWKHEDL